MIGNIALSMAGHDKGNEYVIVNEDAEYVYLCDGCLKTLEKPKKKRKKHVAVNKAYDTGEIKEKLLRGGPVYDHEIKRSIKLFKLQAKKAEV